VSAVEYPDMVRQYRITGVPKTIINDRDDIMGAVPEAQFVQAVIGDM
jgi:predicted DsbA family dithiol-disulfide isomerase